jgi:hypothetical protein
MTRWYFFYQENGDLVLGSESDTSFNSTASSSSGGYSTYFVLGGGVFGVVVFMLLCVMQQV